VHTGRAEKKRRKQNEAKKRAKRNTKKKRSDEGCNNNTGKGRNLTTHRERENVTSVTARLSYCVFGCFVRVRAAALARVITLVSKKKTINETEKQKHRHTQLYFKYIYIYILVWFVCSLKGERRVK
jgi:predicted nucleic acid-binding Zn ribbon protein